MKVAGGTLKFSGSQIFGQITTFASAEMVGGTANYYGFGGSANLGDIINSFSKSHMLFAARSDFSEWLRDRQNAP